MDPIILTLADFIKFAAGKPADEYYHGANIEHCPLAQFATASIGKPCTASWNSGSVREHRDGEVINSWMLESVPTFYLADTILSYNTWGELHAALLKLEGVQA